MKPEPPPYVPANTDFERFDNAARAIFAVSEEEIVKRQTEWKRERVRRRRAKAKKNRTA